MNFRLAIAMIATLTVLGGLTLYAKPARCTFCPSYKCYGSCPSGCLCISEPGKTYGYCYGVN